MRCVGAGEARPRAPGVIFRLRPDPELAKIFSRRRPGLCLGITYGALCFFSFFSSSSTGVVGLGDGAPARPERVGRAAVFLLCHCYCEASNPSKPFEGVFHPDDVLVARKLLKNCLMPHAGYLRLQPYCILDAHPCATVLANTVLERVAKRLDESHV